MKFRLAESSHGALAHEGTRFSVRLISEGQGSSGFYDGSVLERDMPAALPAGTKVYFDHMGDDEASTGRARSIENLVGVLEGDQSFEDGASWSDVRFYKNSPKFGDVAAFMAEAKDDIGVSIEIYAGTKDSDGNVTELGYSPHNSLAIVTTAGARGKIGELIESFRTHEGSEDKEDGGENMLTEQDITAITTPIVAALEALLKPADDKSEAPSVSEVAEAVVSAGLTPHGRESVYAVVATGVSVADAVAQEKGREAAIRESLEKEIGASLVAQDSDTNDWASKATALYGGK
jgi:hypothetical protein